MELRPYQDYAIDCVMNYFTEGGTGNPLVAAPTGTGKSVVIAGLIKRLYDQWGGLALKILVITHSKELIGQNHEKLMMLWPTASAGIYSAGLGRKEAKPRVVFGGIGSVAKVPLYFGKVDMIIVDEAHMISLKESSQYQTFINDIKATNPACVVVGLTATKFRMGQGLLTEGDGAVFTDIVCDMTTMDAFNWFLDEGYLARLRPVVTETEFSDKGIRTVAGEYNLGDLQEAATKPGLTKLVVTEAVRLGVENNCRKWLVFATGIKHTVEVWQELVDQGINATYIHSNTREFPMSDGERDQRIADFKTGKYVAIVNNGILTTGFDDPEIDYIVMTRKTKSIPLWIQMLGRGTRPFYAKGYDLSTREGRLDAIAHSEKPYCLVADFAGNCRELGPVNDPQIPKPRGKKVPGDAPIRICLSCGTYNHASATECSHCGMEFPRVLQLDVKAAKEALIRESKPVQPPRVDIIPVKRIEYHSHIKPGRPDSIRVTYYCGASRYQEWVCLEHEGAVGTRARNWWRARSNIEPPETTVDALAYVDQLKEPVAVHVRTDNGNKTVVNYSF